MMRQKNLLRIAARLGIALWIVGTLALVWNAAKARRNTCLREAVDVLRCAGDEEKWEWAVEYLKLHGRQHLAWLAREAAVSHRSDVPRAIFEVCGPATPVDPTDPGETLRGLLPSIPSDYRTLREMAVYRIYAGNQPEYVDFLIKTMQDAPDPRFGFIPARIAVSSLNVSAGTDFAMPADATYVPGLEEETVEGDEGLIAGRQAMQDFQNTISEVKKWWGKKRASWSKHCKERDVSGAVECGERFSFVDAQVWNEVLVPPYELPLPPSDSTGQKANRATEPQSDG
jgi:hypothetical protein